MSQCVCPLAGYCERHKVEKSERMHRHCQTRDDYFALWEAGRGPGQHQETNPKEDAKHAARISKSKQIRIAKSQALWAELHTQATPTPEWFADWLARIPRFGCTCRKDFQAIIEANPPRYDDFFAWSVEAHNSVNRKLGHKKLSLVEAAIIWLRREVL